MTKIGLATEPYKAKLAKPMMTYKTNSLSKFLTLFHRVHQILDQNYLLSSSRYSQTISKKHCHSYSYSCDQVFSNQQKSQDSLYKPAKTLYFAMNTKILCLKKISLPNFNKNMSRKQKMIRRRPFKPTRNHFQTLQATRRHWKLLETCTSLKKSS